MARRSLLAMLLPTPDEIVRSYLTTDERMILVDQARSRTRLRQCEQEESDGDAGTQRSADTE